MSEFSRYTVENGIATFLLNRPEVMNALCLPLLHEIRLAIAAYNGDPEARCLIITGAGDKAFCAGADLKERRGFNRGQTLFYVRTIQQTFDEVARSRKPVIAAINGFCFGGGLELALACDIRVAVDSVSLGLTETSLAIIPGAGGCARLPRLIGEARAKEMILMAKRLTAQEALGFGLVSELVPAQDLAGRSLEMAQTIAGNGPLAVQAAKEAIQASGDEPLADALASEQACYGQILDTEDRLEGLKAFAEKRKPAYQGR